VFSDMKCRGCPTKIKQRRIMLARDNSHKSPELCYSCYCTKRKRLSSRERKIILAKERKRKRDAQKSPG
jgi:hypothetical protein